MVMTMMIGLLTAMVMPGPDTHLPISAICCHRRCHNHDHHYHHRRRRYCRHRHQHLVLEPWGSLTMLMTML
jgi:hypothetical protein